MTRTHVVAIGHRSTTDRPPIDHRSATDEGENEGNFDPPRLSAPHERWRSGSAFL
jgi:hypothetical protein